ncbi:TPA: small-conductance mechanosensitive channel MscS [Klebsiella aerogenes]
MHIETFSAIKHINYWVTHNEALIIQGVVNLIGALFILALGNLLSRVIASALSKVMHARKVDYTITQFCATLTRYALLAFAIIAALGRIGVETSSIIAIIGAAGLAIGLALQGSLANFAAGVLLVVLRPIRVGEFASMGGVSGTVEEVHIFSTTLRTADNKIVVIPNGKIMSTDITNFTRHPKRRVDLLIGVAYNTEVAHVKRVLSDVVKADPRILHDMDSTIRLSEMAPSSLNYVVRVWTSNAHYWDVYYDLMENIKTTLDEHQIGIPFPQMDIHLYNENC